MTASNPDVPTLADELEALQDEYTYRANMLIEEDREDLAEALSDRYLEDVAAITAERAA